MRVFWFHEVILDIKFCLWNAWSQIKVQLLIARRSNNDLFKQLRCSQTLIYVYRPWQTWEWYLVLGFPNYFCHTIIRIIRWVSLNKCICLLAKITILSTDKSMWTRSHKNSHRELTLITLKNNTMKHLFICRYKCIYGRTKSFKFAQ